MAPIGIALIGGGIWAKEEHIPAIVACPDLSLSAIYSRSLRSAQSTAACIPGDGPKPDLYASDAGPGKAYPDLLRRDDIQAVIVCLPIMDGPAFVEEALTAGKHVFAEKPIAPTIERAVQLIKFYESVRAERPHVTLAIAENFRLLPAVMHITKEARKLGKLTGFTASVFYMVDYHNPFIETEWRKTPSHQGGFVFDAGTHFVAPVRAVLGKEDPVDTLIAYTAQVQEYLPPLDTVHAVIKTKKGAIGTFSMSVGTKMSGIEFAFSFERGSITATPTKVTVVSVDDDGKNETHVEDFERSNGVVEEVAAWAESLKTGKPNPLQSPQEGLGDLEFLEKMFKSGEQKGAPQSMEYQ